MHRTSHTVHNWYTVYGAGRAACKLSGALAQTICNVRSCPKSVRTFSIQNLLHVFERLNAIFDHSCSAYVRISALAIEPQLTRRTVHRATRSADRISCTAHRTPHTIHKRCMLYGVRCAAYCFFCALAHLVCNLSPFLNRYASSVQKNCFTFFTS